MSLSRRVAIVTGCAQGIGKAIARRLAADGYNLALFDLPSQRQKLGELESSIAKNSGGNVMSIVGDVTVEKDVDTLVKETVNKLGSLDVMVANAGAYYLGPVRELEEDKWDRAFTVNVKGTLFCYKHAANQMIKQGRGGRIIGAASTASKQGLPYGSCYSASKFAVRALTQSAALELGQHGITVNAYAPGPIDTTFLGAFDKYYTKLSGNFEQTFNEGLAKSAPAGRLGKPEDVAALVSFIVRDEAEFITGQSIITAGGMYHMD